MSQRSSSSSAEWIERLARFGFAAKGVVYVTIGLLAAQAAWGAGGETTDAQGALEAIVTQPFGRVLLAIVGVGLIGYVLWRFVQTIYDPEKQGSDPKGIAQRVGYAVSGLIYAGISFSALKLALGAAQGSSDGGNASAQDWTARILAQPFGRWLVGAAGAFIIGIGFYYLYEAYKAKFRKKLKLRQMSDAEQTWATRLGRFGTAARGVVFAIIGLFLIQAARQYDPSEARGMGGALAALAAQPYGPWLLGVVALGFVAYGLYMGIEAIYRRVLAPNVERDVQSMISR